MRRLKEFVLFFVLLLSMMPHVRVLAVESEGNKTDVELEIDIEEYEKNVATFSKISAEEFLEKIEKKETFTIYIGRATCYYCRQFSMELVKFNKLIDNQLVYYDTGSEDFEELGKEIFYNQLRIPGTPTTIYFRNGEFENGWPGSGLSANELYDYLYDPEKKETEETTKESKESNGTEETTKESKESNGTEETTKESKENKETEETTKESKESNETGETTKKSKENDVIEEKEEENSRDVKAVVTNSGSNNGNLKLDSSSNSNKEKLPQTSELQHGNIYIVAGLLLCGSLISVKSLIIKRRL